MVGLQIIASPGNAGIRFSAQEGNMQAHANLTSGVTRYLVYAVDPTLVHPVTSDLYQVDLPDAGDELDDIMLVALEDSSAAGAISRFAYSGRVRVQLGATLTAGAYCEVATDGQLVAATQDSKVVAILREGGDAGDNVLADFCGTGFFVKSDV